MWIQAFWVQGVADICTDFPANKRQEVHYRRKVVYPVSVTEKVEGFGLSGYRAKIGPLQLYRERRSHYYLKRGLNSPMSVRHSI